MGNDRAAAVFSDPPYNVAIDRHVSGLGKVGHREFVMAAGEMTPEAFTEFLTSALGRMRASSHPGSPAFICMDWRHLPELLAAARHASLDMLNVCVWTKPNAGIGSLYRSQHELVLVFKLGSGRHRTMCSSEPTGGIAATYGPMQLDLALAGLAKRAGSPLCIRPSSLPR